MEALDIVLDDQILYGECWTESNGDNVTAPFKMSYHKIFEIPEGDHELHLNSYARNKGYECLNKTSTTKISIAQKNIQISLNNTTTRKIGDNLVIDIKALIESFPSDIEYASIDVLRNDSIIYGLCWTNSDEGTHRNPAVSAPVTIGYSLGLFIQDQPQIIKVRAYARNIDSLEYTTEKTVYIVENEKPITPETPVKEPNNSDIQEYVLSVINKDRTENNLSPLKLSTNQIAQNYAEEMLSTNNYNHNKNLKSGMSENIAMMRYYKYYYTPEDALKLFEYKMMYEDEASAWGHRENILNAYATEVSIGVAFDDQYIYLVQDFIN